MDAFEILHNRIDLTDIPFSERGSRLLIFRQTNMLYIRLAERWTKLEADVGHYRKRAPMIDRLRILNSQKEEVPFQAETYPHRVDLSFDIGSFRLIFLDAETILFRLPEGTYTISFEVMAKGGLADRRGGRFNGVRNIAYTTNANILQNDVQTIDAKYYRVNLELNARDGDLFMLNITPRMGFNRSLPLFDTALKQAETRLREWFDVVPPVNEMDRFQYYYAWWIMRQGLLNSRFYFTREALVPSKIHYVGVWHWDQFFHAIAFRHVDTKLAEDQLRILLDHQQPNGLIPDAVHDEGIITHLNIPVDADVTKPPLLAWAALKIFETSGNHDFLEEIFDSVVRWHQWWTRDNYDEATGLCVYHHPFSSGLDDSPLWDEGMPVVAPDLNTYMWLQSKSIGHIANLIGEPSAEYYELADHFANNMVKHLWDEKLGAFQALHQGKPVNVFTLFHLLPLWVDTLPQTMQNRMLNHLTNPDQFWTTYPLATVSLQDPKFDPMQMWRGPSWVNINYLFVEILMNIGHYDLAHQLRDRSIAFMQKHHDIYEYYNPVTGERPPKSAPIFGWTSAVYIDLAIQHARELALVNNER